MVAQKLIESGLPQEQVALVTFAYEHARTVDEALGSADRQTTFLRPVKVESSEALSAPLQSPDNPAGSGTDFEALRSVSKEGRGKRES